MHVVARTTTVVVLLLSFGGVAVVLAGCSYDSGALDEVTCDDASDCTASGSECVDGYCVASDTYDAGEDTELALDAGKDVDAALDVDPPKDVDEDCPPGEDECGGECVDVMSSNEHCGDCGEACSSERPVCDGGVCVECAEPDDCESGFACGGDGTCVECTDDEDCDSGVCTDDQQCVECEVADDCADVPACEEPVCTGDSCDSQPICEGTDDDCGCDSCEDCTASDGWVDDGPSYGCCDGDQGCATCQDQILREYSCVGDGCVYEETDEQTVKENCFPCDSCSGGVCEQREVFEAESDFDVYLEHMTSCNPPNCVDPNCVTRTSSDNDYDALSASRISGTFDGDNGTVDLDVETRAYISFDTSSMPDDADVQQAILGVNVIGETGSNSPTVYGGEGACIGSQVDGSAWNACDVEFGVFASGDGWMEVSVFGSSLGEVIDVSGQTQFRITNASNCSGMNLWGFEPSSEEGPELEVVWDLEL